MLFLGNTILGKSVNVILSKNSRGLGASQRADVFSHYSARACETIMRPLRSVTAPPHSISLDFLTLTYIQVERVLMIE